MLFATCEQIARRWLIRKKQFSVKAKVAVLQAVIMNTAKAGFGFFYPFGSVLIMLVAAGHGLNAGMLGLGIRKKIELPMEPIEKRRKIPFRNLLKKYLDFPLYRAPQAFLNPLSHSLPVLMLASFFGPAAAGFYTLSRSVIGMPLTLLGSSVGEVFYPRISEAANNQQALTPLLIRSTLGLGVFGILPFGSIIVFGPWLFQFVFGSRWTTAGEYSQWMAVWVFFGFMNRASTATLPALSLLRFSLFFEVISVVLRVAALWLGLKIFVSDVVGVAAFSVTGAVLNILLIAVVIHKAMDHDRKT